MSHAKRVCTSSGLRIAEAGSRRQLEALPAPFLEPDQAGLERLGDVTATDRHRRRLRAEGAHDFALVAIDDGGDTIMKRDMRAGRNARRLPGVDHGQRF